MDFLSSKETPPPKAWWTGETVAVVTGANRGIGHALAARLAEQGLAVVLTARDEARGEAAAAALRAGGLRSVMFRRLDVGDPASVADFASWLRDDVGGLDILATAGSMADPAASGGDAEDGTHVSCPNQDHVDESIAERPPPEVPTEL